MSTNRTLSMLGLAALPLSAGLIYYHYNKTKRHDQPKVKVSFIGANALTSHTLLQLLDAAKDNLLEVTVYDPDNRASRMLAQDFKRELKDRHIKNIDCNSTDDLSVAAVANCVVVTIEEKQNTWSGYSIPQVLSILKARLKDNPDAYVLLSHNDHYKMLADNHQTNIVGLESSLLSLAFKSFLKEDLEKFFPVYSVRANLVGLDNNLFPLETTIKINGQSPAELTQSSVISALQLGDLIRSAMRKTKFVQFKMAEDKNGVYQKNLISFAHLLGSAILSSQFEGPYDFNETAYVHVQEGSAESKYYEIQDVFCNLPVALQKAGKAKVLCGGELLKADKTNILNNITQWDSPPPVEPISINPPNENEVEEQKSEKKVTPDSPDEVDDSQSFIMDFETPSPNPSPKERAPSMSRRVRTMFQGLYSAFSQPVTTGDKTSDNDKKDDTNLKLAS